MLEPSKVQDISNSLDTVSDTPLASSIVTDRITRLYEIATETSNDQMYASLKNLVGSKAGNVDATSKLQSDLHQGFSDFDSFDSWGNFSQLA